MYITSEALAPLCYSLLLPALTVRCAGMTHRDGMLTPCYSRPTHDQEGGSTSDHCFSRSVRAREVAYHLLLAT